MVRATSETRDRLRWQATEDDAQTALFAAPDERIRHPEFRDLEFIHVRSKSIINEVPAASRVPFRYTINVYRGCSHACSWCIVGDTPILMADGRWRPLEDVRIGDEIYGTVVRGRYRRYVRTRVIDKWATLKPAYRVILADGTRLIASGDHRFLSDRGWKHVTGRMGGPGQRPYLTTNNKLIGTGGFGHPPKQRDEYRVGYLTGMIRGDGTVKSYSYQRPGGRAQDVHSVRLALVDLDALERVRTYLRDFALHFDMVPFQEGTSTHKPMEAIRTGSGEVVSFIRRLIAWPDDPSDEWCKGFLAGIFDAEGSRSAHALRIANTDLELIGWITACLHGLGFDFVVEPPRPNGCRTVRVTGGLREHLRFFHTTAPAITRKWDIEGTALKSDAPLQVTSIEPLGIDLPMYDITTGTGDFIANGVVSHNCFARPTHEYLNLDAGEDFERVIVVKTNAVDLLRAELHPRRWAGEHIAMGTNTDPYQRAEGRYRLTRGVIEVLTEHRNPFSLLTKSSLVLRDLDLLKAANEVSDIAVNFSIATLDTEVWRATEKGAPHPESRVEALAKVREAGIPAGVLVAPIVPGVSDDPAQLEAVVKAVLDAGATMVSPITLHLRPGVKEQFLPWIEQERPDLVDRYRRLYPGSYAPAHEQRRNSELVRDLVRRHGGVTRGPGDARRVRTQPDPQPDPAPTSEQLDLFG